MCHDDEILGSRHEDEIVFVPGIERPGETPRRNTVLLAAAHSGHRALAPKRELGGVTIGRVAEGIEDHGFRILMPIEMLSSDFKCSHVSDKIKKVRKLLAWIFF